MEHKNLLNRLINNLAIKEKEIFLLQIGAFDGITSDPIHHHIKNKNISGVLIEPIEYYYNKLVNNYKNINYKFNLIFENIAITEELGYNYINWVNPNKIRNKRLPNWYAGHSSFMNKHTPDLGGWGHKDVSEKLKVKTMRFADLINKNKIEKIDIYQSDTEGYDVKILKQLDFNKFNPYIINIESNKLTNEEILYCKNLFEKNNYSHINFYIPNENLIKNSNNTASSIYVENTLGLKKNQIKNGIDWIAWKNIEL